MEEATNTWHYGDWTLTLTLILTLTLTLTLTLALTLTLNLILTLTQTFTLTAIGDFLTTMQFKYDDTKGKTKTLPYRKKPLKNYLKKINP